MINGASVSTMNNPVPYGPDFVCRGYAAETPQATLVAGTSTIVRWDFSALHAGDCFFYLSYDTSLSPTSMAWFKIAEIANCNSLSGTDFSLSIPSWIKACTHCVLRFEWYALHQVTTTEFYTQCVDVTIENPNGGFMGTPQVYVPYHLPADNANLLNYRLAFEPNAPFFFTGPVVAVADMGDSSATSSPASGTTQSPTKSPSKSPTKAPTKSPTSTTSSPTKAPSKAPTGIPVNSPTKSPTKGPTSSPSGMVTSSPSSSSSQNSYCFGASLLFTSIPTNIANGLSFSISVSYSSVNGPVVVVAQIYDGTDNTYNRYGSATCFGETAQGTCSISLSLLKQVNIGNPLRISVWMIERDIYDLLQNTLSMNLYTIARISQSVTVGTTTLY